MPGYISVSEAAKRKGMSRSAMYQAVAEGRIPHVMLVGKIALKEKDVDAYEPLPNDQRKGVSLKARRPARRRSKGVETE